MPRVRISNSIVPHSSPRYSLDTYSTDLSTSALDLWCLENLSAIHHLFHERVDLVVALHIDVVTYSWLERQLESTFEFIFWQSVVA